MSVKPAYKRNIVIIISAVVTASLAGLVAWDITWMNTAVKESETTAEQYRQERKVMAREGTRTGMRSREKRAGEFTSAHSEVAGTGAGHVSTPPERDHSMPLSAGRSEMYRKGGPGQHRTEKEVELIFGRGSEGFHTAPRGNYSSQENNSGRPSGMEGPGSVTVKDDTIVIDLKGEPSNSRDQTNPAGTVSRNVLHPSMAMINALPAGNYSASHPTSTMP